MEQSESHADSEDSQLHSRQSVQHQAPIIISTANSSLAASVSAQSVLQDYVDSSDDEGCELGEEGLVSRILMK